MKQKQEHVAVPRDGKDQFFRRLQLDSSTMKLISNYRVLKSMIDKDVNVRKAD
jgi:hypothetical protein